MTWSLTLAELPRAGANSKRHHYKEKVQKTKDIPKTWVLMGKQFEDFRRIKDQKHYRRDLPKTPVGHQDPKAINCISSLETVRSKLNET